MQTRLSEHYGLFYLLRAMASSERSGILSLTRGSRRAELRHPRRDGRLCQRRRDAGAPGAASPLAVGGGGPLAGPPGDPQAEPAAPVGAGDPRRVRALPARLRPRGARSGRAAHALRDGRRADARGAGPAAEPGDAAPAPVRRAARPRRRHRREPVPHLRHRPHDPAAARRRRAGDPARRAGDTIGTPGHAHRAAARSRQKRRGKVDAGGVGDGPRSARRGRRSADHQPAAAPARGRRPHRRQLRLRFR